MNERRAVPATAVAVTAMLGFAACGGDGADDASLDDPDAVSGTVTMWAYPIGNAEESGYWDDRIAAFEEEYAQVEVEVIVHPWERREERLTTAIAGGQAPDVVYFNEDFIPQGASNGMLAEVDDVIDEDRDDFRQTSVDAMSYEETLYGVPLLQSANPTIYYTDAMDALGISEEELPRTWDELLELGPDAKDADIFLTTYNGSADATLNTTLYPLLWQAGGEVLTDEGTKLGLDSDAGRRTLEFLQTLAENEYIPPGEMTTDQPFEQSRAAQGDVLLTQGQTWANIRHVFEPDEVVLGPPLESAESVSYGTVGGLSVLADSDDQAAAKAWVNFLTSPDQMASFDEENGYYAPRESVDGLHDDHPVLGEEEKYLDHMRSGVAHPQARELMDSIRPHIQALLLGRADVDAAVEAASEEVEPLLASG